MNLHDSDLLQSQAYIDGKWCDADNKSTVAVSNPANNEEIAQLANCGADETERAVAAADAALPAWRAKTAKERAQVMRRWYELMMEHQEDLAVILSTEQGKPMAESRGEIAYAASFFEWFGEEAKRVYGDLIPGHGADKRIMVMKQPIGVTAAITPWNFPSAMITRKAGPALAAGCTMVLKPATETPLSALALAVLAERAGVPAGVFNVVCGKQSSAIGGVLTSSPIVQKLTFTGSTAIGKLLMQQCASTVKKVSMELGGNAPFLVFDDADVDAAVAGAMASKYRNTGQTCVCTNRFIVQDGVYEEFSAKLAKAASELQVGAADSGATQQGPLINQAAVDKVQEHIDDALAKGARVLTGGKPHALGGLFYEPTVLADVTKDMVVTHDETFGPVAPIYRFTEEAEGIAMANDTEFGLAAYFYARNQIRLLGWRAVILKH